MPSIPRLTPFTLPDTTPINPTLGTYVWGYKVGNAPHLYPGFTVQATKNVPTIMRYINTLPVKPILQQYLTIDQTIHWADPMMQMGTFAPYGWPSYPNGTPTGAPQPVVTHLHGAEVQSEFDGGPEQWFTNFPPNTPMPMQRGDGYRTPIGQPVAPNEAVYRYVNEQEGTTLWFHDHALGLTRINVYGGLAAFYFLRDAFDTGLADNPLGLPAGAYEQEIVIQDRQFDTNGQLLFPDGAPAGLNGPPTNPADPPLLEPGVLRGRHRGERQELALQHGGAPALPLPPSERLQRPVLHPEHGHGHSRWPDAGQQR